MVSPSVAIAAVADQPAMPAKKPGPPINQKRGNFMAETKAIAGNYGVFLPA